MREHYDILCNVNPYINDLNKSFVKYVDDIILKVKQNGLALKYVKEQTDEICMEDVKQNNILLKYVNIKNIVC